MNLRAAAPLAAAVFIVSGCSLFRWSGYREPEAAAKVGERSAVELVVSMSPAPARPAPLPAPEFIPDTLYYSDLGPDAVDVSGYPAQQRYNYEIFSRQCSRCHTLARAINSPVQSRTYWHFHAARMSLHSRFRRAGPIPPDEMKAILDFLEYDARVRKIEHRRDFEESTEELKRRFEPTLRRLLEHMQSSPQPRLIPAGEEP